MEDIMKDVKNPTKGKRDLIKWFHENVIQLNFYRVHLSYFIVGIAISSVIIYGEGLANANTEIHGSKLRYVDALFLCTSAMTTTGLNTVNLGDLTAFQQAVLAILLFFGNVVFVSSFTVIVRLYFFRRKLSNIVEHSKSGRKVLDLERQKSGNSSSGGKHQKTEQSAGMRRRQPNSPQRENPSQQPESEDLPPAYSHHQSGLGSFPAPWELNSVRQAFKYPFKKKVQASNDQQHSYLSFQPSFDQRGRFTGLNEDERAEIGGIEYRALVALMWLLLFYQTFWLSLGVVFMVPYSYRAAMKAIIVGSQEGGLNPAWWAFFTSLSSFANGGLNLLDSNFESFKSFYYVLIIAGALTIAGQTYFPVFLRFLIWTLSKTFPKGSKVQEAHLFLLHHPRRCFIYLFPAMETWQLCVIQLIIDFTAWVIFEVLNLGLPEFEAVPAGTRVFDGLFQSIGLRTSGAYIIGMSDLAPATLIGFLICMYVSSFPVVMALRQTNSYEEHSVGLDKSDVSGGIGSHLRRQLGYDIWFMFIAWFCIAIIERGALESNEAGFSTFNILFEVTSGYGTVGLSTGVPDEEYSLSGQFKTLSKVIMMLVMIRGRHRGLPYAIDRSVLVPGEDLMHRLDKEYSDKSKHIPDSGIEEVREDESESGDQKKNETEGLQEQDPERSKEQESGESDKKGNDSSIKDKHGNDPNEKEGSDNKENNSRQS